MSAVFQIFPRMIRPLILIGLVAFIHGVVCSQTKPEKDYLIYVVSESADKIALVRFGPGGARIDHQLDTGDMPVDIDGPHGIVISPDRQFYYVSIAHGRPFGTVWKYATKDDRVLAKTTLGYFPATVDITPDGNFLYVVNFNLHGDPVASSVSVVDTSVMMELARIPTCVMPHGSRVTRDGARQYSGCMMDDLLVEIDAQRMRVARSFRLGSGKEQGLSGLPPTKNGAVSAHTMSHENMATTMNSATCQPTWAQPSVDGKRVYVACNKSDEIVEIDAEKWVVSRRVAAGNGVYNLGVTPDGKLLVATNKRGASVSLFDLATGTELTRLATKRKVVHGVAISPDSRYAFVTVEGIGSEPGTIEVIDLAARKIVATVDTPPQAAGIDFWKTEALR